PHNQTRSPGAVMLNRRLLILACVLLTSTSAFAAISVTTSVTVTEIRGNGNGKLEPDEVAQIVVKVTNTGAAPITSVTGSLGTSTTGVTILNGVSTYPDIPVAGNASPSTPFTVHVGHSVACATPLAFTFTLSAAEGSDVSSFNVGLGGPGAPQT